MLGTPQMADELVAGVLRLRVFAESDTAALHTIFSDPKTHTIGDGPFEHVGQTQEWLRRRDERRAQYRVAWYAINHDGELIGNAGLFIGRTGPEPELGFEVRHNQQGHGYGTAAAAAVVAEAHRAGFTHVWATVREQNRASRRALEKVGFTFEWAENDSRGRLLFLLHKDSAPQHDC